MTVIDLNVFSQAFSQAFSELAERNYPKYELRSGLNLTKQSSGTGGQPERHRYYDALILTKFCQEWTFENDYSGRVPVACRQRATLRATTHQGYPLSGGPNTGNESWLACTWCVDEARIDNLAAGFTADQFETTYIRLDNGQTYH